MPVLRSTVVVVVESLAAATGEREVSIRNETRIGQTLDYHIAVEMTRRVVGTSLASLEATVEGLGSRETAEWSVETVSTKAVGVRCEVAALTVAPVESR